MRASESHLDADTLAKVIDEIQDILWSDGDETEWNSKTVADIAVTLRAWHLTTDNYHRSK